MADEHLELIKEEIKRERRWHIKSIAIADYHRLKCAQHGNVRNHKWTILDTSNELRLSCGYVSESLKLAKAYSDGILNSEMTREKALERIKERKIG